MLRGTRRLLSDGQGVSDNRLPGRIHRPAYRLGAYLVSFGATFLVFVTVTGLMSGFTEFRAASTVGGLFALVAGLLLIAGGWVKERICLKRRNQ